MAEPKQIIHIRIRDLRRERSLTQEELAASLGLSRQSINAMEAGRCLPSLPVALQIASFFSVPLTAVFEFPNLTEKEQEVLKAAEADGQLTALVPWSPFQGVRQVLGNLMDEQTTWQPGPQLQVAAVNMRQTDQEIFVELFVPSYSKDQLSIEVGDDFVAIEGDAVFEHLDYFHREFSQRSFRRTIALPSLVRGSEAQAEMKNGVLMLRIPKVTEEKPKTTRINIREAE